MHLALFSFFLSSALRFAVILTRENARSLACIEKLTIVNYACLLITPVYRIPGQQLPNKSLTPLIAHRFRYLLTNHLDKLFVDSFISGINNGVRLGYSGPQLFRATRNAVTVFKHLDVVSDYIL